VWFSPVIPDTQQENHEFEPIPSKVDETLSQKQNTKKQKGWGMAQVVKCFPSMLKTQALISSTSKN
jgi:hypothetical protein